MNSSSTRRTFRLRSYHFEVLRFITLLPPCAGEVYNHHDARFERDAKQRDVAYPYGHPVALEVAQLAGKIEGERASQGVSIAFEDLLIGSTALHLGYAVATLNVRHFQLIPDLSVIRL